MSTISTKHGFLPAGRARWLAAFLPGALALPGLARAQEGAAGLPVASTAASAAASAATAINAGDTAWMMVCTAFVLFMTMPGLALFYGGLVRRKNVLSVLAQCLGIAGLAALLWWAAGFSLSFSGEGRFIGNLDAMFFRGIFGEAGNDLSYSRHLPGVPESVFAAFHFTFAVITPALIVGAIAERMKYTALIAFMTGWLFLVYFPFAHMVWGGGWIGGELGAVDFAGGLVVHMTSGCSALALAIILGPRIGFGREKMAPHSVVLCMVGTAILWVGWHGFNAGSAGAANGLAGSAFLATSLAAAIGGFVWAALEFARKRQPSVLGFCSGVVGGLVVVTPAAGYVTPNGAVLCGVAGGVVPFFAVVWLKRWLGYDDALDTFGIHAVGGAVGTLLTGVLAAGEINGVEGGLALFLRQAASAAVAIGWSVAATVLLALVVKATIGLRPTPDVERQGLDVNEHGEEGYAE